jgi:D-alanyl-D-alanine carboxypeptidase (penicillin-binding protein 5/6)
VIRLKKIIWGVFIFFFSLNVKAMSASSYVVMDMESNRVLASDNMNNTRLIASITKIMTCIVAIENSDVDREVTVGDEILKSFGSSIYLSIGEKIKLEDLLYGLMLRSGNDAALVISKNVSNDFVTLMNKKAQEIGMKNTYFLNPHGLEENDGNGNTSSAYDMGLLMGYAYHNDEFRKIIGTKEHVAKSNEKSYSWQNKNRLLREYKYATGGKTGFTMKARRTLVTTAEKDNMKVVVVTLNDGNDFLDHKNMYESIWHNYHAIKVLDKDYKIDGCNNCYIKNEYYAMVKNKNENLKIVNKINKNTNTDYLGDVLIYDGDYLLHDEIIYKKKIEENKKSWWKKIMDWFRTW